MDRPSAPAWVRREAGWAERRRCQGSEARSSPVSLGVWHRRRGTGTAERRGARMTSGQRLDEMDGGVSWHGEERLGGGQVGGTAARWHLFDIGIVRCARLQVAVWRCIRPSSKVKPSLVPRKFPITPVTSNFYTHT